MNDCDDFYMWMDTCIKCQLERLQENETDDNRNSIDED
jgi:hypothetical protein